MFFVRSASEADLPKVQALLGRSWHATYDAIYGAEKVAEITASWHSLDALKRQLARPNSEFVIADDGRVFFTTIDPGATYQRTRLFRWDGELTEIATDLGSGGAVDGAGTRYFAMAPDGDRWELVSYALATGQRRRLTRTEPGQYVLGAQVSPDGSKLVASVWDRGFVLWIVDAASGVRLSEIRTDDRSPVFDGSFADDATVTYLATIDGRFQVVARDLASGATRVLTDAPYAVLAPRVVGDRN